VELNDIGPAITGDKLIEVMRTAKLQRQTIVEGLLYENTILMVSAAPGVGKSTISTQIAIEMAAGLPVFGVFTVAKPTKVLYAQTERPILEFLERAEIISRVYPIIKENLVITDEYKMLNLLREDHVKVFIECIKRDCPGVEVIFIDPIYPMVAGGLSKDEPASAFCKAMSLVQKETGATLYYNHHTSRPQHDSYGAVINKDDPFYGSQWLKAHITGSYHMQANGEEGVKLSCKKDNYHTLTKEISLDYNPETGLSIVPLDELPPIERVKGFFRARELDNRPFSFKDIQAGTQLCTRTLRTVMARAPLANMVESTPVGRNKVMYRLRGYNQAVHATNIPTPP
jgi:hypothetical protein